MITYSTCAGCGNLLHITDNLDHHNGHPPCTPRPTKLDTLTQQWLDAALTGDTTREHQLHTTIIELATRRPRLLDAALTYAAWGWPVFPLRPHTKIPATRNGFKDATTDETQIRQWWTQHPNANIGLPTGHRFDVIDIDLPQGWPAMVTLTNTEDLTIHGHVATSSGGAHFYVLPTGRGNTTSPGVDYRGKGGYVVAPPSTLGTPGRAWSWVHKPSPHITGQGDTFAQ